jgi:chromosomal replication initiation ATPase DnaA
MSKKEITLAQFSDDLSSRIKAGKTIDCCKDELLLLAKIVKEKIGDEKVTVDWKDD